MSESNFHIPVEQLLRQEDWVRRLVRRLVRDENQADDIVQEAYVAALRNPPVQHGATRAWLGTVVRATVDRFRKRDLRRTDREREAVGDELLRPAVDLLAEREERRRIVVEAVTGLAEPYRSTIILRYFEEMKPSDIASHDGVPVSTVKSRLKRGLDRLRAVLDAEYVGDRRAWLVPLAALYLPREAATGAAIATGAAAAAKTGIASLFGVKSAVFAGTIFMAAVVAVPILLMRGDPEEAPLAKRPESPTTKAAAPLVASNPDLRVRGFADSPGPASKALPKPTPPDGVETGAPVPLPAQLSIAGTVRWRWSAPVDHVYVQAVSAEDRVWEVETDQSGRFEFPDLPKGRFTIVAQSFSTLKSPVDWGRFVRLVIDPESPQNEIPRAVSFKTGITFGEKPDVECGTQDLVFTVDYPVILSGRVVDAKSPTLSVRPVRPHIENIDDGRAMSDRDGRFVIVANGPVAFRLQFLGPPRYRPSEAQEFRFRNPEHKSDLVVQLDRELGGTITGRVRFAEGVDPVKAMVQARNPKLRRFWTGKIDPNGRFTVEGAIGEVTVMVGTGIYPTATKHGIRSNPGGKVDAGELVIRRGGGLSLNIVDERGHPIRGARVELTHLTTGKKSQGPRFYIRKKSGSLQVWTPKGSRSDGRWDHPALPPGDYQIVVRWAPVTRAEKDKPKLAGGRQCRIRVGQTETIKIVLRPTE